MLKCDWKGDLVAHPKKGEEKWKPELCEKLVDHLEQGFSLESFGAIANCHSDMLYKWRKKYPEFDEACRVGQAKGRYFWEKMGQEGAQGLIKNFSATVWIFTMKCRFGYRDGSESGFQSDSKEEAQKIFKTTWRKNEAKAKKESMSEKS